MRLILLLLIFCACSQEAKKFDIQGHRGARGLMPENSVPGFIKAIDLGVTTIELDLVVTKDGKLLVSHEPFLSIEMCADTLGQRIVADSLYNIFQMLYDKVKRYDCGSLIHPRFPEQQKIKVSKPLFSDVISTIENHIAENHLPQTNFNIELKTKIETDNIYHPTPEIFSEMVFKEISNLKIWERVNIQSFDFRTLQYFNGKYPEVKLALLIENNLSWQKNIDSLGFVPEIYSCNYQLLSPEIVKNLQLKGMDVIPWTVNDTNSMIDLMDWGVDGIITDYPDRAMKVIKQE